MGTGELPQELIDQFVGASHGDLSTVQALLAKHPALLSASARWKETPIQAAAHAGSAEVARLLLAQGASLEICTAAMLGMTDQVRAFLADDPGQAHAVGAHGIPAMFHAAIGGHMGILDLLVAHGADVNQGEGGNTALHGAARFGQMRAAQWLIEHGAHINVLDYEKKTPLQVAVEAGRSEVVDLLRRHGGRPAQEKT